MRGEKRTDLRGCITDSRSVDEALYKREHARLRYEKICDRCHTKWLVSDSNDQPCPLNGCGGVLR